MRTLGSSRVTVRVIFLTVLASSFLAIRTPRAEAAGSRSEVSLAALGLAFGSGSAFGIAPGYHFQVLNWLQLSGIFSYQTLSYGSTSVRQTLITIGPTFNDGPLSAAIFFSPAFTLRSGSGSTPLADGDIGQSGSGLSLTIGRRLPVLANVSWRPSVGLVSAGVTTYVITPLAIDYFF